MFIVRDIIEFVERLSGHTLNVDEGVVHGPADRAVRGVTVCWTASPEAIISAGECGDDLLIGHESLHHPSSVIDPNDGPPGWQDWKVNAQRRGLLDRYGMTCLRLHGSLDEICIFDDFAALLGLAKPVCENGMVKVYEIAECSLEDLIERVKAATGMPLLRVCRPCGAASKIRRVGLPWGGVGLFVNVSYQQALVDAGCDAFIAGEADNYGFRFARESGIPMIETSHEVSENPGLRHFTEMLAAEFPDLLCSFFENSCVFSVC